MLGFPVTRPLFCTLSLYDVHQTVIVTYSPDNIPPTGAIGLNSNMASYNWICTERDYPTWEEYHPSFGNFPVLSGGGLGSYVKRDQGTRTNLLNT